MHEWTIAQSIVELSEEAAAKEKADTIQRVHLEIGTLSGVVLDTLKFALEFAVKKTKLKDALIDYSVINGKAICHSCNLEFETADLLAVCPNCKLADFKIVDGKQLRIKSLTI
jgi:hydrogenase nickel incorporation protein HypA/HybF